MRVPAFLFGVFFLVCSTAQARSLHWQSIHVDAQLDRNGTLTVAETQTFVFDGDWNGGERTFDIRSGQQFELLGLDRIENGKVVPLFMGDLNTVDRYQLNESVLRWRSRLPSDPPFENSVLTYRIRYRLGGILQGRDGRYRLNHDFLFPDRAGVVEKFSLRFGVDPVWTGFRSPLVLTGRNLQPGEGFLVTSDLGWAADGRPAGAIETGPAWHGRVASMSVAAGVVLLIAWFLVSERRRGRWGRLVPTSAIDEQWLRQHVFALSPEAVGAGWDDSVGAHEVAAALASLVQQGAIETKVEKKRFFGAKLTMHLRWPRTSIHGHHRTLVNKLFFNNRTNTDTDAIRKHYRTTGLDLAAIVKPAVESELSRVPGWNRKVRSRALSLAIGLLLLSIALLIPVGIRGHGGDAPLAFGSIFFGFIALAFGCIFAAVNRNAMRLVIPRMLLVLAPAAPLIAARVRYLWSGSELLFSAEAMAGSVLFALSVVFLLLAILRSPDSPERLEFRRTLASGRRYLREQLRSSEPQLQDAWFPYILALGLGSNVDRWFRKFGPAAQGSMPRSSSSSFGSSSVPATWSGGGGGFGGAGASGAWVMAAAGVAAGVSKPGSSSGGGGGGGGSSSGGGGGGGW